MSGYLSVPLKTRQREILRLIEQGHDTAGIAAELGIAPSTARSYVQGLARIFQCRLPDLRASTGERG